MSGIHTIGEQARRTRPMNKTSSILIGNSFPLSLIRRKVSIEPQPLAALRTVLDGRRVVSFWGHANTLARAEEFVGCNLVPASNRPVLKLTHDLLPTLENETFSEVWILSPDYTDHFRPAIGEEVPPEKIAGWQILKLTWESQA